VPQTTRNAIRGILNRDEGQLVFVDTPGRHLSERKFNRKLMETAGRAAAEAELILYVLDAIRAPGAEEAAAADWLAPYGDRLAAAVNKMDSPHADFNRARDFLGDKFPALDVRRCFPVSALKNQGMTELLSCLFAMAEPGEPLYPADYYTDQDPQFRIAEIIREQAIRRLRQELPHSIYVEVADSELRDEGARLWVRAFIITERESQKGMVVGKGGEMIKAVRQAAQKELNRIFDWKVELDLRVKTVRDWRHSDAALRRIIS
jgi:GTP-binding protein Era